MRLRRASKRTNRTPSARDPCAQQPARRSLDEPAAREIHRGLDVDVDLTVERLDLAPERVLIEDRTRGFMGARPNPIEELTVAHFHRTLAEYMGTGGPVEIG